MSTLERQKALLVTLFYLKSKLETCTEKACSNLNKNIRWILGLVGQAPSVHEALELKATSHTEIHFISLFLIAPGSFVILFSFPAECELPPVFCEGYFHHRAIYIKRLLDLSHLKLLHQPLVSWKDTVKIFGNWRAIMINYDLFVLVFFIANGLHVTITSVQ